MPNECESSGSNAPESISETVKRVKKDFMSDSNRALVVNGWKLHLEVMVPLNKIFIYCSTPNAFNACSHAMVTHDFGTFIDSHDNNWSVTAINEPFDAEE